MSKIDVIWDMETGDPDDILTLFLLIGHPKVVPGEKGVGRNEDCRIRGHTRTLTGPFCLAGQTLCCSMLKWERGNTPLGPLWSRDFSGHND
jgi:hypothetical protein